MRHDTHTDKKLVERKEDGEWWNDELETAKRKRREERNTQEQVAKNKKK